MNKISLEKMTKMTIDDIASLDIEELEYLLKDVKANLKSAQECESALHRALMVRFDAVKIKDAGTHHVKDGKYDVSISILKKVKWDEELLKSAWDNITDASHYIDVSLSVSETKYIAAPPAVQAALLPARTVSGGKPTFVITKKDV